MCPVESKGGKTNIFKSIRCPAAQSWTPTFLIPPKHTNQAPICDAKAPMTAFGQHVMVLPFYANGPQSHRAPTPHTPHARHPLWHGRFYGNPMHQTPNTMSSSQHDNAQEVKRDSTHNRGFFVPSPLVDTHPTDVLTFCFNLVTYRSLHCFIVSISSALQHVGKEASRHIQSGADRKQQGCGPKKEWTQKNARMHCTAQPLLKHNTALHSFWVAKAFVFLGAQKGL